MTYTGLRLALLNIWTPNFIISKELDRVSDLTTDALKELVKTHVFEIKAVNIEQEMSIPTKNVQERRFEMANEHAKLVDILVSKLGRDEALVQGRKALFEVGRKMGEEARLTLGVSDNPRDLIKAAKIMYRILGINFTVEWYDKTKATLIVNHCELAKKYSEFTCLVLSATDEGVVKGLAPKASMMFRERMTSGCRKCKAKIEFS